jgi:hypothetical protein
VEDIGAIKYIVVFVDTKSGRQLRHGVKTRFCQGFHNMRREKHIMVRNTSVQCVSNNKPYES